MSLTFITVNSANNGVVYAGNSVPFLPTPTYYTTIADDTDTYVKDLINNINSHTFDVVMTGKPYLNASYDGTNVNVTLMNPPVTVPTTANISLLGQVYSAPITTGKITFPITIHPAVAHQRITVSVRVDGFPFTTLEIAGSNGNVQSQIYKDSNNVYQIVPVNSADLAYYWTTQSLDPSWEITDLATVTGLTAHVLFHYVLPALANATYTPVTLSADESNALTDIQTNILPNIVSLLSNIAPKPATGVAQSYDIHYASYKDHIAQAKTAMTNYTTDRNKILQYTTLK